jgi:hypothetical protein
MVLVPDHAHEQRTQFGLCHEEALHAAERGVSMLLALLTKCCLNLDQRLQLQKKFTPKIGMFSLHGTVNQILVITIED